MEENRVLLEKFSEGRCNPDELAKIKSLLNTGEGDAMFRELFIERGIEALQSRFGSDAARREWLRTKRSVMRQRIAVHERRRSSFYGKTVMMRVAAVFVGALVLGGGMALWRGSDGTTLFGGNAVVEFAELSNPGGIPVRHVLADGTQVWLAAGSTLKYPERFEKRGRNVELQGEAFFDVARDEKRPFTIKTGDMETRVLGTSFKITAYEGHEHEVSVATGKVSVNNEGKELALLTRGASVRHNPDTGETTRVEIDPQSLENWKSGTLTFNKLPMGLVAEQLKSRYGIELVFADPGIATRRVSSTFFPEESATVVLDALGFIGKFQYRMSDEKHYTIY